VRGDGYVVFHDFVCDDPAHEAGTSSTARYGRWKLAHNYSKLMCLTTAERCWSGRTGLPAKQLHPKRVSGVRIPPSPPYTR
jgi:hypothetical protein